jgi:hypothetical protein
MHVAGRPHKGYGILYFLTEMLSALSTYYSPAEGRRPGGRHQVLQSFHNSSYISATVIQMKRSLSNTLITKGDDA